MYKRRISSCQTLFFYLRGHEGGVPSSVDPHAVEGQLQTGTALGQAAAKVSDHQTRATICTAGIESLTLN